MSHRVRHAGPCVLIIVATLVAPGPSPVFAQDPSAEAALETGIGQVREGQLDAAILTLDTAVRQLRAAAGDHSADLVRAFLYQGWAFVGLDQEDRAKQAFRDALALNPALRLNKGDFPDRVIRVFEAARAGKTKSVMERPNTTPKKAGIGGIGVAAIVVGALALGGAAVAAGKSAQKEPPPTVSATSTPTGALLVGATVATFMATGTAGATFSWNLGDGSTAAGPQVTHVYNQPGTFNAVVTATTAAGSTTSSVSVLARSLTGRWDAGVGVNDIEIEQNGALIGGQAGGFGVRIDGTVSDPRVLEFSFGVQATFGYLFRGLVGDDQLNTFTGTLTVTCDTCVPCETRFCPAPYPHVQQVVMIRVQ